MTTTDKAEFPIEGATIKGEPVVLRCTLGAMKKINAYFGNFLAATSRVASLDAAAMAAIIAAGTNSKVEDGEQVVFDVGMEVCGKVCHDYVDLLANGGKPWKDDGKKSGEA